MTKNKIDKYRHKIILVWLAIYIIITAAMRLKHVYQVYLNIYLHYSISYLFQAYININTFLIHISMILYIIILEATKEKWANFWNYWYENHTRSNHSTVVIVFGVTSLFLKDFIYIAWYVSWKNSFIVISTWRYLFFSDYVMRLFAIVTL